MRRGLLLFSLVLLAATAHAHKPSDSYLRLRVEGARVHGEWDIALRDLENAIGIDSDGDGRITWGEVRRTVAEIESYALGRLRLSTRGDDCPVRGGQNLVNRHTDGAYHVLRFVAACPRTPETLGVRYTLFDELDPQHRGLLRLEAAGTATSAILAQGGRVLRFEVGRRSRLRTIGSFAAEGFWHAAVGADHILFLICLMLPLVVVRRGRAPRAGSDLRAVLGEAARVVSAFTLAHSITLSLASAGLLALPSRLVEVSIAASVVLAALDNVWPWMRVRRWQVAFGFGLLHGLGFAGALSGLELPRDALVQSLLGFHLGVEAAQLVIVAIFLPAAYSMRGSALYTRYGITGGSLAIAGVGALWLFERIVDLRPIL